MPFVGRMFWTFPTISINLALNVNRVRVCIKFAAVGICLGVMTQQQQVSFYYNSKDLSTISTAVFFVIAMTNEDLHMHLMNRDLKGRIEISINLFGSSSFSRVCIAIRNHNQHLGGATFEMLGVASKFFLFSP